MAKKRTFRTSRVSAAEAARLDKIRAAVEAEFPPASRGGAGNPSELAEQLRAAIRSSGLTHYALGKQTGMAPTVIDKFMNGLDIRLSTAARLAAGLSLEFSSRK